MIKLSKKNRWKKLMAISIMLSLLLGFGGIITPEIAYASEEAVFTVEINDVEEESFTLADLKAMPATTRSFNGGFYKRTGVDFIHLLESLDIDYNNWTVKLIMTDVPSGYTLNFSYLIEPLLAYEESINDSEFFPIPLKFYYGSEDQHNLVYQNVVGIKVTKPETLTPPALEADSTDNTVGKSIELTFEDDETWRNAISEVTVNGSALESGDYTVEAGKLTIDGSVFTEAGDYEIVVKATEYENATVIQTMVAVPEPAVFTVEINDVEEESFTLADLKAMPATTRSFNGGFYKRTGVDFIHLLESLGIDYNNWIVKLIMTDVPSGYTLNFSYLIEPLLAYEESINDSEFFPIPLKFYYGSEDQHNLVYQNVVGIKVTKPETLTPPALEADSTDNTVGKSIELIFEDDETWRNAISEVTVNGSALESGDYTVEVGKLTIDGSVFTEAGDYEIVVKATEYEDAAITQVVVEEEAVGEVPPVLTASTSGNTVGNPIVIKYPYEYPAKWEPVVTAAFVDSVQLESWQYNIGYGKLTIAAGIFNEVKDYTITVEATGYQDATVMQTIEARPELFVSEGKGNIVSVAGRGNNTVAIKNDGTVWAWGDGQVGKLGDGTTGSDNWRSVPGKVSDLTGVTAVAPGENHTLALKNDGTVWAWGSNSNGVLGNENISRSSSVPVQVITDGETGAALTDIKAIAAGDSRSLALKEDGTVWAWGSKRDGQLGDGESSWTSSKVPVQVITDSETGAALTDIKAIAAGDKHSLALKEDGTVWAWGRNSSYGQLGNGSKEDSSVAVQVMVDPEAGTALTDVKAISAGQGHSFALKNDGTLWAWGWNGNAQLGNGSTVNSSVPIQVVYLTDIQSISAGANHVMALKNDDTIWVWGSNYYSQLGIGADIMSYIPTRLCEASDIAMINAGYYHSMAVKNDGTVWTWGQNTKGKLGNGTTENYPDDVRIPTQIRLAPQAVVPAVESAILGDAVELDFTDDTAWRESITAVSVDEIDLTGEQYTVEDGKIIIAADAFTEVKEHTITIKASGFLDAIVVQQIKEVDEMPKYNAIPKEDPIYTIGETEDGIKIMTVNDNQTGLNYFTVSIESIEPHEGTETVIFAHIRDGVQLQLNALEADFDEVSAAKAGFNVKPGDIIKVYIVDKLTNDSDLNPIMLQ